MSVGTFIQNAANSTTSFNGATSTFGKIVLSAVKLSLPLIAATRWASVPRRSSWARRTQTSPCTPSMADRMPNRLRLVDRALTPLVRIQVLEPTFSGPIYLINNSTLTVSEIASSNNIGAAGNVTVTGAITGTGSLIINNSSTNSVAAGNVHSTAEIFIGPSTGTNTASISVTGYVVNSGFTASPGTNTLAGGGVRHHRRHHWHLRRHRKQLNLATDPHQRQQHLHRIHHRRSRHLVSCQHHVE